LGRIVAALSVSRTIVYWDEAWMPHLTGQVKQVAEQICQALSCRVSQIDAPLQAKCHLGVERKLKCTCSSPMIG
jgi:hypothetical protein